MILTLPQPGDFDVIGTHKEISMHHGSTMTMTFKVEELLETLKNNFEEHKQIVEEAKEGYQKAVVEELEAKLELAKEGEPFDRRIQATPPEDHSKDYERTIRMLEMTTCTEMDLTGDQFECYVMDRWHWQEQFLTSNMSYSSVASMKRMSM